MKNIMTECRKYSVESGDGLNASLGFDQFYCILITITALHTNTALLSPRVTSSHSDLAHSGQMSNNSSPY